MTGVLATGKARTTYTHRYDNLRSALSRASGPQTLVWDAPGATGFGDLVEELTASGLLRAYYRGPRLVTQKGASSQVFHWMDQGTLQILTDSTQAVVTTCQYSAWGEQYSFNGTTTPLAANGLWGYYQDTTARSWVQARHLDVGRGRWFSQDPLGFLGGPNLYSYVGNYPTYLLDPYGLRPISGPDHRLLKILWRLQGGYRNNEGGGPQFDAAVREAVKQIKADIAAVPQGAPDPPGLKAAFWAIDKLGDPSYGYSGYADNGFTQPIGPPNPKCNLFVETAYGLGAGLHFGPNGVPTNPGPRIKRVLGSIIPAPRFRPNVYGADVFYYSKANIPHFHAVTQPPWMTGDLVAFGGGADSHVTVYIGGTTAGGLLIYAGRNKVKAGTVDYNVEHHRHKPPKYRRYSKAP